MIWDLCALVIDNNWDISLAVRHENLHSRCVITPKDSCVTNMRNDGHDLYPTYGQWKSFFFAENTGARGCSCQSWDAQFYCKLHHHSRMVEWSVFHRSLQISHGRWIGTKRSYLLQFTDGVAEITVPESNGRNWMMSVYTEGSQSPTRTKKTAKLSCDWPKFLVRQLETGRQPTGEIRG